MNNLNCRQEAIVFKLYSEAKKLRLEPQPFFEYEQSVKQKIYKVFSSNFSDYRLDELDYEDTQKLRVKNLLGFLMNRLMTYYGWSMYLQNISRMNC